MPRSSEMHHVGAVRAEHDTVLPPQLVVRAEALTERFIRWLDGYGAVSQDPHDFWASMLGTRAKNRYYRHRRTGAFAAAPFVFLDLVVPRTRSLARPPARSPIADAHYALGFFDLARTGGSSEYVRRARTFLATLELSRVPAFADPAWGYPFDWPTRAGVVRAETPLITTVPYCYEAFQAGYESLRDESYLATMEGAARFAAENIAVIEVGPGVHASAYTPYDRRMVVNASAYRGFLLTAAGRRFAREDWIEAGAGNVAFVLRSQRADGSWPYALDGEDFVDNFHTCLVLKNLAKIEAITGDDAVRDALHRGYGFYLDHLLDASGLPVPFARQPRLTLHRRDLYDYAEGVTLARLLVDEVPRARVVLERLVYDLADRWQLPDGHFVTRELKVGRNTLPYHRWAQSQTFRALAALVGSAG